MTQDQFDKAFKYLSSNPWRYGLSDSKLPGTRALFYHKLKNHNFKTVYQAFDAIIDDKTQECFPSLQRVLFELSLLKPIKSTQPRPKQSTKNKELIRSMLKKTGDIMRMKIPDKQTEIHKMVKEFKKKIV